MASAPAPFSSAGWKTPINVPAQLPRSRSSAVMAPTSEAVCTSCPQACMTPGVVLAYGSPVSSSSGSASMSARIATTGPGPLRSTATSPVPPHGRTSAPVPARAAATASCVRCSSPDSSGCWWRSR
jgi:hypothetical protein